jgi:hypothetical protein
MKTKEINGIEYIIYEAGMLLNDPGKSYYFEDDTTIEGDVTCLHLYAINDFFVGGYQVVKSFYLHLYCPYAILIRRDSDRMNIGCVEKSVSEWESFFANKESTQGITPDMKSWKLAESAFHIAKGMRSHLALINEGKDLIR